MTKAEEKDLSKETEEGKAEQNVEPGNEEQQREARRRGKTDDAQGDKQQEQQKDNKEDMQQEDSQGNNQEKHEDRHQDSEEQRQDSGENSPKDEQECSSNKLGNMQAEGAETKGEDVKREEGSKEEANEEGKEEEGSPVERFLAKVKSSTNVSPDQKIDTLGNVIRKLSLENKTLKSEMRIVFEQLERNNEAKVALKALNDSYKVQMELLKTEFAMRIEEEIQNREQSINKYQRTVVELMEMLQARIKENDELKNNMSERLSAVLKEHNERKQN